jgi:hypothetical protein
MSYKGRALLCLLGVALGVAVFVGIKTAASSALTSFRDTVTSLAGNTQLRGREMDSQKISMQRWLQPRVSEPPRR